MGTTRRARHHCEKFVDWLQQRNPFTFEDEHLHSLSPGLVLKGGIDDMTTEPLALLKGGLMRKPDKPLLRKALMNDDATAKEQISSSPIFTIGGALMQSLLDKRPHLWCISSTLC